ncbi:MAG: hypothetical protein JST01_23920 [Cyanobacteria bacterium SZAS TMP-1]|nr:hypothetical protein [Cyanobacteria bacterium SZAS TMP-1]
MQFKLDGTTRLHLLLIVAATFLAFGIVMTGYFIADDTWQLQFCYRVFHGEPALVIGNFFRSYLSLPSMDFYRPLLGLTYLVDYALYHTNAAGYYLTNILMAACAGVLLYFIARSLVPGIARRRAEMLAISSALLFVVSPLHCEDICWISGRADLLAAPLYFAAMLAAIYARDWSGGKIRWANYITSLLFFTLSLMSKESAVTLPLVVAAMFTLFPQAPYVPEETPPEPAAEGDADPIEPAAKAPVVDPRRPVKGPKSGKKNRKKGSASTESVDMNAATQEASEKSAPNATAKSGLQNEDSAKLPLLTRLKQFVLFMLPYGLITVSYLFVRQRALGSFIGGYTGDMGQALSKWLLFRWIDPLNLLRISYPVSKYTFHVFGVNVDQLPIFAFFGTVNAVIFSILIVRLFTQKINLRLTIFLVLWLLASLIPLVNLWGLDASLHNQRVLYLFTAPFVMIVPSLLFMPKTADRPLMSKYYFRLTKNAEDFFSEISFRILYVLAAALIVVSALTSYTWVLAGQQVKAIQTKTAQIINSMPDGPGKKMLVVSVPKDYLGAHVLMGGVNMLELLEPPFTPEHISQYMIGFQRALVGPGEPINSTRLKLELHDLAKPQAYFWEPERSDYKVVPYEFPAADQPQSIDLPIAANADEARQPGYWVADPAAKGECKIVDGVKTMTFHDLTLLGGDGMLISGLDINPLAYDYLSVDVSMPRAQAASGLYVSFDDNTDARAPFREEPQVSKLVQVTKQVEGSEMKRARLNIKVSHFGQWYSYSHIRRLKISFSNIRAIGISNVSLSDERGLVPNLFVRDKKPRASGEYFCDDTPLKFVVNGALVKGATGCLVQISKVNQSWDTFLTEEVNGRDNVVKLAYTVPLDRGVAGFSFDPRAYAENGFYDVRVGLVNDKNERVSDWSDIITLYRPDPHGARAAFCADY